MQKYLSIQKNIYLFQLYKDMNKIEVGNTRELNDLVCASAVGVKQMLEVKNRKSTRIEPWWKKRMEAQVKQLNKDLGHINTLIERKNVKRNIKIG